MSKKPTAYGFEAIPRKHRRDGDPRGQGSTEPGPHEERVRRLEKYREGDKREVEEWKAETRRLQKVVDELTCQLVELRLQLASFSN